MKKRLLASLLSLAMVLTLLPVSALAAGETVAKIGGSSYDSLAAAVASVPDNGTEATTIVLTDNIVMSTDDIVTISAGMNVVLDMNGHSITVADNFSGRPIVNNGALTITGNGTIDSSMATDGRGSVNNDATGTLTIENGTFRGNLENGYANVWNAGTAYFKGGIYDTSAAAISTAVDSTTIINGGSYTSPWYPAIENRGKMTITGGEFKNPSCSSCNGNQHWGYTIRSGSGAANAYLEIKGETEDSVKVTGVQGGLSVIGGSADIYNGVYETLACKNHSDGSTAHYAGYFTGESYETSVNVHGGSFTSCSKTAVMIGNSNPPPDSGAGEESTVMIYGGTFTGGDADKTAITVETEQYAVGGAKVFGGNFSSDVSKYVPEGYIQDESGTVAKLGAENAVAQVDDDYYKTLADAVTAAGDGETVTLLRNATSDVINIDKNLTIDLAGFTLTGTNNNYVFAVQNDYTVTIKGGTIEEGPTYLGLVSAGNVTLENCTITTKDNLFCYGGTVLLKDTDLTATGSSAYGISLQDGTVTIDKDSSITAMGEGRAIGIFIKGTNENSDPVLNVYGKINTYGATIQGNGSDRSYPVINIYPGAVLTAVKTAMYLPQPGTVTIDGATVTGYAAIGMKSGTLNIHDSMIHGIANDDDLSKYPDNQFSSTDGITCDGSAIVIDSYIGYAGAVNINITGDSLIKSDYSTAIREIGNDAGQTNVVSIDIESGRIGAAQGKDTIKVREVTKNTVNITGGYFTSDPSAYLDENYIAGDSDDPAYTYQVVQRTNIETPAEVVPAAPTVDTGDLTEEEAQAVSTALAGAEAELTAAATTQAEKNTVSEDSAKNALNGANITVGAGATVTVVVQPYLDITVKDYVNNGEKELTLDITPKYRTVATTANLDSGEIKVKNDEGVEDEDANAVEITGASGILPVYGQVEITIPLPDGFVDSTSIPVYVQHKGYEYNTTVTGDNDNGYTAAFTNPHGFSTFTISTKSQTVATVNGVSYTSFQAAVDAAKSGDTIVIPSTAAPDEFEATISGSTNKSIKVENQTGDKITVTINGVTQEIGANEISQSFTYSYTPSSGGGSSTPTYTVSKPSDVTGGEISVSPSRAAKNATVTITVKPDEGYELDELIVCDSDGETVELTQKSDTEYTFKMPASKVTVEVSFVEIEPVPSELPFTDVAADAWYHDAVAYVYDNGMMNGVTENTFAPNATTTRGMIVTMLHRLEGEPGVNYLLPFTDVAEGLWYTEAVRWAASEGIVNGVSDTAYAPDNAITREQMAAILYRYAQYKGYDTAVGGMSLAEYTDADQISSYATTAMQWANENGLITGRTDTTLVPQGTATRAEVATILMRFCENIAK